MLHLGKTLDFDIRFCEAAIADLLDNEHINEKPILFDETAIAECFLRDGLRLALVDEEIHAHELSWLKSIARANNLPDDWLDKECQRLLEDKDTEIQPASFEIQRYL